MLANILYKKLKDSTSKEVVDLIKAIYMASSLSNCLISDLLDYQLIEHDKFTVNYSEFDLKKTIKGLFKILSM